MKAIAAVLYFPSINDREEEELKKQFTLLEEMYGEIVSFLEPRRVGEDIPAEANVVVFPQLIGAAFSERESLSRIKLPIVVITSGFGTVEMWDWEIVTFMRDELGLTVFSPYNTELAKCIFRAISCKSSMKEGVRFLMFQDSPGEGMQANIFKRFYWWEHECTELMEKTFGLKIIYKSYKQMCEEAKAIPDVEAEAILAETPVPSAGVDKDNILNAVKIYIEIKRIIEEIGGVEGAGANCLNESFLSDTTPCLAWNLLFERDGILWACEGDTVTMISKFILYRTLKRPMMMTNIYPFLVGMAALKHERIDRFPEIENPDNHALGVHCGYFGFAPQSFCESFTLCPKVLEIVNERSVMVDCRMGTGPVTLAKIHPSMKRLTVIACEIVDYVQYPGSDCRNGALIHYKNNNGHEIMDSLSSHHAIIIKGDVVPELIQMSKVFDFEVKSL